jgi:hypothetical protein
MIHDIPKNGAGLLMNFTAGTFRKGVNYASKLILIKLIKMK